MLKALLLSIQVSYTISVNFLIHFLKMIPGLGKKIPDSLFQLTKAKQILSVLAELLRFSFKFLGSAIAIGCLILVPMYFMDKNLANTQLLYHYFFFYSFITGPLSTNIILQAKDINTFAMVKVLKLDKRDFYIAKILYILGQKAVRYLLLMALVSIFTGISLGEGLILAGYIVLMALIWEYLILTIFDKSGKNIYKQPVLLIGAVGLGLLACYALPLAGVTLRLQFLSNAYVFSAIALLAGGSFWRLYSFRNYAKVTREILTREDIAATNEAMKNAIFADVNLAEKKLVREEITGADNLQAYDFFNHLFFARHQRIIWKPVRNRILIISLAAVTIWGLLLLRPELQQHARETLLSSSPYFLIIMYMLSTGERFSKALFFNCDRYMLREVYYRDKEAMLKNFSLRLKKSISLNLLPAAAVAVLVLGTGALAMADEMLKLLPIVVSIFSLALFFSTHYLFIYYMLQPYTVDLTQKSPLYFLANGLIWLICYIFIFVKTASIIFTSVVIVLTLLYAIAAVVLTYNIAPKTFKLK